MYSCTLEPSVLQYFFRNGGHPPDFASKRCIRLSLCCSMANQNNRLECYILLWIIQLIKIGESIYLDAGVASIVCFPLSLIHMNRAFVRPSFAWRSTKLQILNLQDPEGNPDRILEAQYFFYFYGQLGCLIWLRLLIGGNNKVGILYYSIILGAAHGNNESLVKSRSEYKPVTSCALLFLDYLACYFEQVKLFNMWSSGKMQNILEQHRHTLYCFWISIILFIYGECTLEFSFRAYAANNFLRPRIDTIKCS
jgi:hypothetical protein